MQPVILVLGGVAVFLPAFFVTKAVIRKRPGKRDQVAAIGTGCAAVCFGLIAWEQGLGSIGSIALALASFSALFWHRQHRRELGEQSAAAADVAGSAAEQ